MKKKIMIGVIVLLLVAMAVVAVLLVGKQRKSSEYQEQISLGDEYLNELDYDNAEICYQKAIEIDGKRASAYVNLSMVYVNQNRYQEAQEVLEKARETVTSSQGVELIQNQQQLVKEAAGGSREEEQTGDVGQVPEKEETVSQENGSEESQQKEQTLFDLGSGWVSRNGWSYLWTTSGMYLFQDGQAQMSASESGNISYSLMAVDGGVYYGQDQALKFRMNDTGEVTIIYQGRRQVEPLGMTENALYFAEYKDDGQDSQVIHQMDRTTGSLRTFTFSDFCEHSRTAFCGERFFYTKGVADVSTSGVKEVDVTTGQARIIAEDSSVGLLADGDILYYIRAKEKGDYTQTEVEVIRWDTVSNKSQVLATGTGMEINGILGIADNCVYTSGTMGILEIGQEGQRTVASQGCIANWADESGVYYTAENTVYRYDSQSQSATELITLDSQEYVVGVGGGYLTYRSGEDYKRLELGS